LFSVLSHPEVRQGARDAAGLPGIALAATMLGFATMSKEAGLSLLMTMLSTAGVWGLPGQVAMVGLFASGSSLILIFLAVTMANMRMLLMVISASDSMGIKHQQMPAWKHMLLFHFMAATAWLRMGQLKGHLAPHELTRYYIAFTIVIFSFSLCGTALGFYIGDIMPPPLLRVLIYITPLYLILLALSGQAKANRLAVMFGGLFVVMLMPFMGQGAIFVAGFAGGGLALAFTLREDAKQGKQRGHHER